MELLLLLAGLGAVVGFLSGLLGIGGGIIMTPLLLHVPSLCGFPPFSMREAAGLTIVQGLAACVSGLLAHRQNRMVSGTLTAWMGASIFLAALAGGAASDLASERLLLTVFSLMALSAALLAFAPVKRDSEQPSLDAFSFSRTKAVFVASAVGFSGGLVGQGGSFLCIPLMTSFMHVPTRIAIGSNLAIVLLSSMAAFVGKAATGQILWRFAVPIVVAALPAARLGSLASSKAPVWLLRRLLAACIILAALRTGLSAAGF